MPQKQDVERFISDIKKTAKKHGIKVIIEDAKLVYAKGEDVGCVGYFDESNGVLSVASKNTKSDFLGLLAHESSHLDQWVENKFVWDKLLVGYATFFDWLGNKGHYDIHQISEAVQDIIRLEKDCEIRAIKKIRKYNLPIDITTYKKKANSYLYAYLYFTKIKKWIPAIYKPKFVWDSAPSRFPSAHTKIPHKLLKAFEKITITGG